MRGDGYRAARPRCIGRFKPGLSGLDDIPACLSGAGRDASVTSFVIYGHAYRDVGGRAASGTSGRGSPVCPACSRQGREGKTPVAARRRRNPVVLIRHSRAAGMTTTGTTTERAIRQNRLSIHHRASAFLDSSLRWNDDGGHSGFVIIPTALLLFLKHYLTSAPSVIPACLQQAGEGRNPVVLIRHSRAAGMSAIA